MCIDIVRHFIEQKNTANKATNDHTEEKANIQKEKETNFIEEEAEINEKEEAISQEDEANFNDGEEKNFNEEEINNNTEEIKIDENEAANFNEEEEEVNYNIEGTNFNEEEEVNKNADEEANFNEEESNLDADEEYVFDIDSQNTSSSLNFDSQDYAAYDTILKKIKDDIFFCTAYYIDFEFDDPFSSTITFKIPTSILPLSVSVVNGFYSSPYLLQCKIELNRNNLYGSMPLTYEFTNLAYGNVFPGSVLVKNRFRRFFKLDYVPQDFYKCQNYVLAPQINVDQSIVNASVKCLVAEGFPENKARKALMFCSFDLEQARDFLISGLLQQNNNPIPVKYEECPLFFLILEICEAFFDIGDSCCVCGKKLGVYNLKPACCNERCCQFSFMNLGLGSNIIGEIKRDPIATDFIIVLAGAAYNAPLEPPVFEPSPLSQGIPISDSFFKTLPPIKKICEICRNDQDIINLIGRNHFEILRFFILANKAQLITLPDEMKTSIKVPGFQFLITSRSPESELIFREKREKFGVKWLWHGSRTERWYRILHTGLKDLGRTKYQLNGGPWFGDGIYMSDSFAVSLGYAATETDNVYKKSTLPKKLRVISLVENANVNELNGPVAPNEYTQKDDSACITRVLFVIGHLSDYNHVNYNYNTLQTPPTVPTLREVLSFQMEKYI